MTSPGNNPPTRARSSGQWPSAAALIKGYAGKNSSVPGVLCTQQETDWLTILGARSITFASGQVPLAERQVFLIEVKQGGTVGYLQ